MVSIGRDFSHGPRNFKVNQGEVHSPKDRNNKVKSQNRQKSSAEDFKFKSQGEDSYLENQDRYFRSEDGKNNGKPNDDSQNNFDNFNGKGRHGEPEKSKDNGKNPPPKPKTDFSGTIASYLVKNKGISEDEANEAVEDLEKKQVIHDPVEAVKVHFGITDEEEAKKLAEDIFGAPPKRSDRGESAKTGERHQNTASNSGAKKSSGWEGLFSQYDSEYYNPNTHIKRKERTKFRKDM